MSSFWSLWITVLTLGTIAGVTWLLFANRKSKNMREDGTTGHVYDGIQEYDNPLPAWWFYLFVITIVFGIGYLIAYPGLGNYKGLLGWTQEKQWQEREDAAKKKYAAVYAQYRAMSVKELAANEKAMKMGQRLFAVNCAQCHGSDAMGGYGFPNLTDDEWLYGGSPEQIQASITNGRNGAMPAWGGTLSDKDIGNVANYVMSLSGRQVDRAAAAAGQKIFQTYCTACHGADAKGNVAFGAPNLTNNIWLYGGSAGLIQRTIRNGRSGKMPAHKDMSKDKIHLLTAYVFSLSAGRDK